MFITQDPFFRRPKMRIAVCFSGMIRTGVIAAPLIKNFFGDLYDSIDFYMHTWDISEDKDWHRDCLALRIGKTQTKKIENGYILADNLQNCYNRKFVNVKIENLEHWRQKYEHEYKFFSPLWYSWQESIKLKTLKEAENGFKYDVVIKMRPDIIYPAEAKLQTEINHFLKDRNIFYAIGGDYALRIDDVFFLSRSDLMDRASSFFTETKIKTWTTNNFGEYLSSIGIPATATNNNMYTVLRTEALVGDINNFNLCFNTDRKYHAPYNHDRLPV